MANNTSESESFDVNVGINSFFLLFDNSWFYTMFNNQSTIIGPYSCRSQGIKRPICFCVLYVECAICFNSILAYPQEGLPAH